jgi:hypothetical protein
MESRSLVFGCRLPYIGMLHDFHHDDIPAGVLFTAGVFVQALVFVLREAPSDATKTFSHGVSPHGIRVLYVERYEARIYASSLKVGGYYDERTGANIRISSGTATRG